ncbi:MmgE/PrpD family protein [Pelagibius sp.]|uniref:MmgE/PrpD family protein n=1 Tax=Pelagibius sp. TaxID=1931238 RepID=UPI003BB07FED
MTERLAEFALGLDAGKTTPQRRNLLRKAILDTVVSAIAGTATVNARQSAAASAGLFGKGNAAVWGTDTSQSVAGAIFANCAAASALDVDDGHRGASGHAGAAIVPAALTYGSEIGVSGTDVLNAILAGYEVALRVGAARRRHDNMSFASGRWAGYGVAAALGRLAGLSRSQLAHAIAIAGTEAPMNLPQGDYATVSSVKGSSPWSSITAFGAMLRAREGATGPIDILDRPHAFDKNILSSNLGECFEFDQIYFKPYASCRYTHPAVDAILDIRENPTFDPTKIEHVEVRIFPEARKISNEISPKTLEGAQFSTPFVSALALLYGAPSLRPMTEKSLSNSAVLRLAASIDLVFADEFRGVFPGKTPATVKVSADGQEFSSTIIDPLGDPANSMDVDHLSRKAEDLLRRTFAASRIHAIVDEINDLDAGGVDDLASLLAAAPDQVNTPNPERLAI